MNEDIIKKYEGKRVLLVLKNNFQYTATIPKFKETFFEIIDKFGKKIIIECEYIAYIREVS